MYVEKAIVRYHTCCIVLISCCTTERRALNLLGTMVWYFSWRGDWCGLQLNVKFLECQLVLTFHGEFALRISIMTFCGLREV